MKKIKFLLIAAAVITSVGGAFATTHKTAVGSGTYGIVSEDDDYYYVSLSSGTCDQNKTVDCEITTTDTPDGMNRVPKDANTAVSDQGNFTAH